jgi:predicted unusual protein kinase regulating ubiquinone biosynthesis (AarF/ABC1/UbiB family)
MEGQNGKPMERNKNRESSVPQTRLGRLSRMTGLATRVAGGMLAEGARRLAKGERPKLSDMLLTPANARRVADQLARLRGAAMKLGQLLSMDAGDLLPPELADILARLRSDAQFMPQQQLEQVLRSNWGPDWRSKFSEFSMQPMAAASIGQVHAATALDGTELAVKVQYPGVRTSIDSDVDNVVSLLSMSGLIPDTAQIKRLLIECKRQLHEEADYMREAECLSRFGQHLAGMPEFVLPMVRPELSTRDILVMTRVGGEPVENFSNAPQDVRNHIVNSLFKLLFIEVFELGWVQTDPNFANFRYDSQTRQIILLDFGAARPYDAQRVDMYRQILSAAIRKDRYELHALSLQVGYYDELVAKKHQHTIHDMIIAACEPAYWNEPYPFGQTDLAERMRDWGMELGMAGDFWHVPPVDSLMLQRKLAGLYLLSARLKGHVDFNPLVKMALG